MTLSGVLLQKSGTITHLKQERFDKNGKIQLCQPNRCVGKNVFKAKPTVLFNIVHFWSSLEWVLPNGIYFVPASDLARDLLTHFWKKLHVAVYGSG